MAISPDYLQELSQRTDIAELVGGYVQLRRPGAHLYRALPVPQ